MKEYFLVSVFKMSTLDNYEKGEIGKTLDHGMFHSFKAKSFDEILKQIDNNEDAYIIDDRIEFQCQENDAGYAPTKKQLQDFKDGKTDLWACTYTYRISLIVETDFNNTDLIKSFPTLMSEV